MKSIKRSAILLILTIIVWLQLLPGIAFPPASQAADISKYTDGEGTLHLTNVPRKEEKQRLASGFSAARSRCKVVVKDLKDLWLYYENFKIYKIGFSVGLPVNTYSCTISATRVNSKDNIREARIEINQRADSTRFTYRIVPNDEFPECHEELITSCSKTHNK